MSLNKPPEYSGAGVAVHQARCQCATGITRPDCLEAYPVGDLLRTDDPAYNTRTFKEAIT